MESSSSEDEDLQYLYIMKTNITICYNGNTSHWVDFIVGNEKCIKNTISQCKDSTWSDPTNIYIHQIYKVKQGEVFQIKNDDICNLKEVTKKFIKD